MRARIGGAWTTPSTAKAYIGGTWQTPRNAKAYVSGAWRDVATFVPPLSLTASPDGFYGAGRYTANSQPLTATPTGGLAPFTYAWAVVSSSRAVTIGSPTSATTVVSGYVGTAYIITITLSCTVTDSLGSTATATVSGELDAV